MGHGHLSPQTITVSIIEAFPPSLSNPSDSSKVWGGGKECQVSVVGVAWSAFEVFLGKDINVWSLD